MKKIVILIGTLSVLASSANAWENSLFYHPPQSHGYDHNANCPQWMGCKNDYELRKDWGGYNLYDGNGNLLNSFNTWDIGW